LPVKATASDHQGNILHLQRLSTEDGPGIRTTVFFKGCPLRCVWCHNPESFSPEPQLQWLENRCIGCHTCLKTCPNGCLSDTGHGIVIDRQHCQVCGTCAEACPSNALELLGRRTGVMNLLAELEKDRAFYLASAGGVTLSGGEPTYQPSFAEALLHGLQEASIPVALDTCGLCSPQVLERLLPLVDLVLYDLKVFDPVLHRQYTGRDNYLILKNLRQVLASEKKVWVRTPLIPGCTFTRQNIDEIGAFLSAVSNGNLERWELCAFNNLCRDKYRRLGMDWSFSSTPLLAQEQIEDAGAWAKSSGFDPGRIFVTGASRVEIR
jgi:pyruvate formate lyase activating enzyme